jgi:HD-GYP domain-containing protein (c-di-GMP phosphodiesterase class II)
MQVAGFGNMEIIYDHRPMGLVVSNRIHGFSAFSLREGSLSELESEQDPASIKLFVTSPDRLRSYLNSSPNAIQRLCSLAFVGIFLVEDQADAITVRLKKRLVERGSHLGIVGYVGAVTWPFSYNDFARSVVQAAEKLYLKCHESYFNSIAAIREVETRAMHDLGSALSGHASAHEMGRLVLDKCMSVSEADAGFLLMSDVLFEEPRPDGKTVKILGHVVDSVTERAKRCLSQDVNLRSKTWSTEKDPLFRHLSTTGRSLAWNEGAGYLGPTSKAASQVAPEFETLVFEFPQELYRISNYCAIPIRVPSGEVIGAVVLVNRRAHTDVYLDSAQSCQNDVREFSISDLIMLEALAHQAGASLDHARLLKNLKTVFESFVQASVVAIESRDPSTKGHSVRVATLTVALAEAVTSEKRGPLANINFTPSQIYELKYASLLHDFGKIGVREDVLQKEKKLFPRELSGIRERFLNLERQLYLRCIESYLEGLMKRGQVPTEHDLARIRREVDRVSLELRSFWNVIIEANEPQVVKGGSFQTLAEIAAVKVIMDGHETELLTTQELERLSIRKGSLSNEERLEIERHVSSSYKFLLQIPWTKELGSLPDIVWAHHERLDGSGYPRGLGEPQIPVQAKIMAVCDVYDALIAMDRPYKKALPHGRAMAILEAEVQDGKLDPHFFNLFREREIYRLVLDDELRVAS